MSEAPTKVWFSVFATIPDATHVKPYMDWLETQHMHDVIKLGKALRAELHLIETDGKPSMVEGRYEFASKKDLEIYNEQHAPSLRAQAIKMFPQNQYQRYVSFVKAQILPYAIEDKKSSYADLEKQLRNAITPELPWESKMVSLIALLKSQVSYISWVGFYRAEENNLWVGPYQGPLACAQIPFGKGVCGYTAQTKTTTIVEDVETFPGHIACDSLSRSEIVLPVFNHGKLLGVLDVDSYRVSAFDRTDAEYLEKFLSYLED